MKKFKKIILTLSVLLTGLVLASCAETSEEKNDDKWETYLENKKIVIGFDNTFVPMGFKNEEGENVGFDIDLANAVFAEYGIEVEWKPITWSMKEAELDNGTIDLIWNGYSVTDERKEKVLFSDIYMETEEVLIVKKESPVTQLSDMADKVVGAQAASSGYEAFENNPAVLKDIVKDKDAVQYSTFTQAFIDLENDRIDALLVDKVYANYYLAEKNETDNYRILSAALESGDFAVGARKTDVTLIQKINEAFKKLYQEGTFQEISQKWFNEDTASPAVKGEE